MHLWLNPQHTPVLDAFMRSYTLVGEWIPYIVVALLLFYKAGWSVFLLADVALSGLIGQGLKYLFDTDRPLRWFADNMPEVQLQLVDGVTMSKWYSFPSGHTTTFFALFFTLAIILSELSHHSNPSDPSDLSDPSHQSDPSASSASSASSHPSDTSASSHLSDTSASSHPSDLSDLSDPSHPSDPSGSSRLSHSPWWITLGIILCFLLAVLGGYSRIYLSQHFAEDIFGGALLGTLTTILLYWGMSRWRNTPFWNWNLLSLRRK